MKKLISLLTGIGLLSSCAGLEYNTGYIPEEKKLREIENDKSFKKNVCLIKSVMYSNHLTSKGIENYVIIKRLKDNRLHSVVKYWDKSGQAYYSDPTWKDNDGIKMENDKWD